MKMGLIILLSLLVFLIGLSITVNAIDITDCTNMVTAGATYYLTEDIIESTQPKCMNITVNNITLDCQGHLIDGDDAADYGIMIYRNTIQTTNVTVKNCRLNDWDSAGIYLYRAERNNITNVTINSSNYYGLFTAYSDYNHYSDINISGSKQDGLVFSYSNFQTIRDSYVTDSAIYDLEIGTSSANLDCDHIVSNVIGTENKPIVLFNESVTLNDWNNNISQLILCDADNSVIDGLILQHTLTTNNGLQILFSDNVNVKNSIFGNLQDGIYADTCTGLVINNTIIDNVSHDGLFLDGTPSAIINNVSISGATVYGIDSFADSIMFSNLYIHDMIGKGIWIDDNSCSLINSTIINIGKEAIVIIGDSNTIHSNIVQNSSTKYCITLGSDADSNIIYNNFFNCTTNVYFTIAPNANTWNVAKQVGTRVHSNGIQIAGNYWTNPTGTGYSDTCTDSDTDGFCDLVYDVEDETSGCSSDNCDNYPYSNEYFIIEPLIKTIFRIIDNSRFIIKSTGRFYMKK